MKTPDDIPDGTECFHVGDDSERLRNLLAVLHRDGGHHAAAVGVEQACVDATKIFYDGLDAVLSAERTRDELNDARNVLSDEFTRVTRERDAALEENRRLVAQVEHLGAIIAGRTAAPTDAEIEAHDAAGGLWRCVAIDDPGMCRDAMRRRGAACHRALIDALESEGARWWALDAQKRPCAWPVVTSTETESP